MIKRKYKALLITLGVFVVFFIITEYVSDISSYYVPEKAKIDLEQLIKSGSLDDDKYNLITYQTGLGRIEIDEIMKTNTNYIDVLNSYKEQNFSHYEMNCKYIFFPITKVEELSAGDGEIVKLKYPELKKGDILITRSTHTLFFRHGHAGLITDGNSGEILEAMALGSKSSLQNANSWMSYPTIAILRPKNLKVEDIDKIIDYAKNNLCGINYSFTTGFFGDAYAEEKTISKTQCAHLVWSAYKTCGIDIDSNGGSLVLPQDILKSRELDLVWSYGINMEKQLLINKK